VTLSWDDFMALPQTEDTSDFHCVTTWSRMDVPWKGVRLADLAALVSPKSSATHILCHGYDKYTTNLSLQEALKEDVLLVHTADNKPFGARSRRAGQDDHPPALRMERKQMDQPDRVFALQQTWFLGVKGLFQYGLPWRNDRYS
jgi:hypothetical protein